MALGRDHFVAGVKRQRQFLNCCDGILASPQHAAFTAGSTFSLFRVPAGLSAPAGLEVAKLGPGHVRAIFKDATREMLPATIAQAQ